MPDGLSSADRLELARVDAWHILAQRWHGFGRLAEEQQEQLVDWMLAGGYRVTLAEDGIPEVRFHRTPLISEEALVPLVQLQVGTYPIRVHRPMRQTRQPRRVVRGRAAAAHGPPREPDDPPDPDDLVVIAPSAFRAEVERLLGGRA